MTSDPLSELRAIFWDEVEDALDTLDRAGLAAPPHADASAQASGGETAGTTEELRARFEEAYRLVHSLKGAARAVGFRDIEALCHSAEEKLGARGRQDDGAPRGFEADVARVAEALRFLLVEARAGGKQPVRETAASGADVEAPMSVAELPPEAPAAAAPPVPQAPPLAGAPAAGAANALGQETIRVPITRLGRLVRASERLVESLASGDEEARAFDQLDQGLLETSVELSKARRALGASDAAARVEALQRIESALTAVRALGSWSVERRSATGRDRANLASSGREVASETRSLRMVPLASLGPALEHAAQDAARALGKRVLLDFDPHDVELDRKVRDGLREPLLHAVRNAVDHGLETEDDRVRAGKSPEGVVSIRARVAGSELALRIQDDGRGVDEQALVDLAVSRGVDVSELGRRDRLGLLFRPGWSTRHDVNAFSGRGVGLDVVRQRIAALRGRVEIESVPGAGTTLLFQVPLDLSATRLVLFAVGDAKLAIVSSSIERLVRVPLRDLARVGGQLYLPRTLGGDLVPLADLPSTLGFPARTFSEAEGYAHPMVVVVAGDRRIALRADALLEERDAVVAPMHPRLRSTPFVLATTFLADGEIAIVLDAEELATSAVRATVARIEGQTPSARGARRILLVDDSVTTLQLERTLLETAGFEVKTAPDGEQALRLLEAGEVFDAVVTDIEMPRLDGLGLAARIRRRPETAGLPIVLVTGLAQDEQRQRALDIGVNAYIVKGRFDEDELVGVLEQLT